MSMGWNETMVATSGMKLLGQIVSSGAGNKGLVILSLGTAAAGYFLFKKIEKLETKIDAIERRI